MENKPKIPKQEPKKLIAWVIAGEALVTVPLWKDWLLNQFIQFTHFLWP